MTEPDERQQKIIDTMASVSADPADRAMLEMLVKAQLPPLDQSLAQSGKPATTPSGWFWRPFRR
jgi:hypothetical protein